MSKFKPKPSADLRSDLDPKAVEQFASGAGTRSLETLPWAALDPKAKPTSGINLRLNDYELAVLRFLAEAEDRSIQKTIKRLLMANAEAEAKRLSGS